MNNYKDAVFDGKSIIDELQKCISIYYSILDPSVNYIKANEIIMKQNLQIQKFLESPILVYKDTAVVNVPEYINKTYSGLLNSLKLFPDLYKSLLSIKHN